jgi:inhibitor of KinA
MAWHESVRIDPLGENAFVLRGLGKTSPVTIANALLGLEGIADATPAYETVGVYVQPEFEPSSLRDILANLNLSQALESKSHKIPVCYTLGEDIAEAAEKLGIAASDLIAAHSGTEYRCFAIGFQPGFPFLGYLPESIAGLARKDSPRTRVPKGSVGITGRQTGIYPSELPGGWWLVGRTPLTLVDLEDAYFPISAGDLVRFLPIDEVEFRRLEGHRL